MNQVQPVAEIQVLELLQAGDDKTLKIVYRQNYQTVVRKQLLFFVRNLSRMDLS
jgi:hypothetical protein